MTSIPDLSAAWNAFFHTPEPPFTIAFFRILFGLVTLASAILYRRDAALWVGPHGLLSHERYMAQYGRSHFSLFAWLPPTEGWMRTVFALHFVAAACLTAGLASRVSAALVFVTLTSIHHRNPEVTHAGDSLMRIMSFLLMFSRAGDAWSIDAALAGSAAGAASPWCLRVMQLQVSIVYFQSFVAKMQGETWRAGSAVYWATTVSDYRRRPVPAAVRTLAWSRVATWSTLAIEFALGPLVWVREWRYPIVIAAAGFHLALDVFMNIQLFGAIMVTCLTLFARPDDLLLLVAWLL